MALTVKKNTSLGVETESTEGVYAPPSAADDFVQTLSDGFELAPTKELLDRNIFTSSVGKTSPRTGQFQVSGTIPVEARANPVSGGAPEADKLFRTALGSRKQITTTTTTKASGNTASVLHIEDADISKFAVGDIIKVLQAGAYHVTPVITVVTTIGAATITVLIPHPSGDFTDSVVIDKMTLYKVADSGHPSLSVSKYVENAVLEQAVGCKVASMSLENFTTGQLPSFSFGIEGLNFDRSLTAPPFTPSYQSSVPPIVLDARAYMDNAEIEVNEVTVSLENTLGFETAISAPNGRIASRVTERAISGTFNPYKRDNDISNFTKYKNNTSFSLFAYAKVPTGVAGEFDQIVALYMPNCLITELTEADQDGLLQEPITFVASRGNSGTVDEIYMAFI